MGITCIVLAVMALAQADVETYEFRHGDAVYYGTVEEHAGGAMVRFVEDAPWKREGVFSGSFRRSDVDYGRETTTSRERRHREGWESRGYVNASRSAGSPQWVPREEAARAARAMEMAEPFANAGAPAPPIVTAEFVGNSADGSGDGSFAYGPHALVVVLGLLLAGLVTRLLILPG